MKDWRYYNHSAVSSISPHKIPNISVILNGDIWDKKKLGGRALLARWTTDWDCGYETEFWYVIKDTPFDITSLKAKRRYEITKGKKNFDVKVIDPLTHIKEIHAVQMAAYESYPKKYRPKISIQSVAANIRKWDYFKVYGAFFRETGALCGYLVFSKTCDKACHLNMLRAMPEYEKFGINAALTVCALEDNSEHLSSGGYINDGARNILHETNFQDYLEKYFGFRKAYCKLHISYNPKIKLFVYMLYPFRNILKRFNNISLFHKINGVLMMEQIRRSSKDIE